MMNPKRIRVVYHWILSLTLSIGAGCTFGNREDAKLVGANQTEWEGEAHSLDDSDSPQARATAVEYPSNLIRSSGEVVGLRLKALFPRAATASGSTAAFLQDSAFESLTATGINKTIADENRPTSSVTQIALRNLSAKLCKRYLDTPGGAAGTLFSTTGILVSGETTPSDADLRTVWAAARNGWLDLFDPQSEEVQELLRLYRAVKGKAGGTEALARQSVCMAVLLAPQFLMGNSGPRDPIRRLSLELGRTLPRFQDLADYQNGTLTTEEFARRLQTDTEYKTGYRAALKSWHRDWWGLREFRNKQGSYSYEQSDPRGTGASMRSWSEAGSVILIPKHTFSNGHALVDPVGYNIRNTPDNSMLGCEYATSSGAPNLQAFDPRTVLVVAEHRNTSTEQWEVVGGWVHEDRLTAYQDLIKAYDAGFSAADHCVLMTTSDPKYKAGAPLYYRCEGRVTALSGGLITTSMRDFYGTPELSGTTYQYPSSHYLDLATETARTTHTNQLNNSIHASFQVGDRRIRRQSPSGWQTGVSEIKAWWSGDTVYICNGFARYAATCSARISSGGTRTDAIPNWLYTNNSHGYTPAGEYLYVEGYRPLFYGVAPMVLNQHRCGVPDVSALPASFRDAIPEDTAYPRGYDFTDANYLRTSAPGSLNDHSFLGEISGPAAPGETAAVNRLQEDLVEEPFRLLNKVLDESLPYSTLLTADYTLGREELELAYRSHFLGLPSYPPDYSLPSPTDSRRDTVRVIRRSGFPAIPLSWTRGPYWGEIYDRYQYSGNARDSGMISPLASSGILTMPAFLGPVSQKLRTVSARIFERLLCSQLNSYSPTGAELDIHSQFMSHPSNLAPADHLDSKTSCFGCHINLDPLSSALSGNFLANVKKDEIKAVSGEFLLVTTSARTGGFLGARGNSEVGSGALFGKRARGFREVGQILADSPEFYRCTVSLAFEKVLGRLPLLQDQGGFNKIATEFQSHKDFDRMIRDLVKSRSYQREN